MNVRSSISDRYAFREDLTTQFLDFYRFSNLKADVVCMPSFAKNNYLRIIPPSAISKWFSPVSPDLKKLADEGEIFTCQHDRNLLSLLQTLDLIDKDVPVIDEDADFEALINLIRQDKHNFIAVVDAVYSLKGVITIDDLRPHLFNRNGYEHLTIRLIMKTPTLVINERDDVVSVVRKFDETGAWDLPVVGQSGNYLGFIAKVSVLSRYRRLLQEHSG